MYIYMCVCVCVCVYIYYIHMLNLSELLVLTIVSTSPDAVWINNLNAKSRNSTSIKALVRAITDVMSNALETVEEVEQVVFDVGSTVHLILWEKNIRWHDTGLKYIN